MMTLKLLPTTPGRFLIGAIEKHISLGKYNFWSAIPWGSPLRMKGSILRVKLKNVWIDITKINSTWSAYSNDDVIRFIKARHKEISHENERFSTIPQNWIFNDFGHVSIKYFKDKNNNLTRDKNENLLGDFIHTTPEDEAATRLSPFSLLYQLRYNLSILKESHGCIHVKPRDIDLMIEKNYIALGNVIQIHHYSEKKYQNL